MNSLKKFLFLCLIIGSFQVMGEDNFLRFAIEKSLYQEMSDSQQLNISLRIQQMDSFVTKNIIKAIPKDIYEKLSDLKIKVSLNNSPGRDGVFTPGNLGEHTISIQLSQINNNGINALLAHEIYHAIHFHLNPDELPWVREGMAQLFEFISTGELNGKNLSAAIKNPMTPLLGDYNIESSNPAQYGHNMLYFYYLYNRCGKDKLFWKITEAKNLQGQKGSFLIDEALKEMNLTANECEDFSSSAISFEVAKIHNEVQFLSILEKNKYAIAPMEITPTFSIPKTEKELENTISNMPALSSFKMPLLDFKKLKGTCSNCEIFYAQKEFPFTVSEKEPKKTIENDVILVKTHKK